MRHANNIGRWVGILLLVQLAAGLMLPFILIHPLNQGFPEFLTAGAANSFQIRTAVFISFIGAALTVGIGIKAFPVIDGYSRSWALFLLVACVVSCALDLVHSSAVMSMLSLSREYVAGNGTETTLYQAAGKAAALARRSAHYTQLLAIGVWIFAFYAALFRFRLVPRALAALGLVGVALQFTGVTLMGFLGYAAIGEMAMPLLPIQIIVCVWLIVKGFGERPAETISDLNLK